MLLLGAAALALAWLASVDLTGASRRVRGALLVGGVAVLAVAVVWIERFRLLSDGWQGRVATHSVAWSGLGEVLLLAGDGGASAALRRAAQLRPDDVTTRANLAILAATDGDLAVAVRWLEQACEVAPADQQFRALISSLDQQPVALGCTGS